MFKKFATAEIVGVKSSPTRLGREASLSKFADYNDFRTDDGYIYVRVRAISSRVNKNHDGWPSAELSKSYKTFLGKPNFVDHHNHDPERMRGVVVDAKLHVDDPAKTSALDQYYASAPKEHMPPTWIELLIETDAKAFPKLAKAIVNGEIDGVSMGCNVERSKCSHCGNWATNPDEYCQHIRNKGAEFDYYRDGQKTAKSSYEDCYDIGFFEISYVFDPADETALFLEKPRTAAVEKESVGDLIGAIITIAGGLGVPLTTIAAAEIYDEWKNDVATHRGPGERGMVTPAFILDWVRRHGQSVPQRETPQQPSPPVVGPGAQGLSPEDELAQGFDGGFRGSYMQAKVAGLFPGMRTDTGPRFNLPGPQSHGACEACGSTLDPNSPTCVACGTPQKQQRAVEDPTLDNNQMDYSGGVGNIFGAAKPGDVSLADKLLGGSSMVTCPGCGMHMDNIPGKPCWHCGTQNPANPNVNGTPTKRIQNLPDMRQVNETRPDLVAKVADTNQVPQSEMTVAPEKVDTLRQEQVCPICGSMMEDGICEVCNFEEPPEGFGNPDLTKAQDTDDMQQQQGLEAEDAQQDSMQVQNAQDQGQGMPQQPGSPQQPGMPMAASFAGRYNLLTPDAVSSDRTAADLSGGRVNTKEKPLLPGTRQTTDKPIGQKTISDSKRPVESSSTGETMTDTTKTADTNAGEELTATGERVSPEAVGGVATDENPEGHKTVSVDGVGAVDNDENPPRHKEIDLEAGLKEEIGGPTKTWGKDEGDSLGQASPVSGGNPTLGSKHIEILAADSVEGDVVTPGGEVVNLEKPLKEEIGGPTDTWSTADSFHETDPVTREAYPTEGEVTGDGGVNPAGQPFPGHAEGVTPFSGEGKGHLGRADYRTHMIAAMRLAETEIALGITAEDEKYDRIAELEQESPESLAARQDTVSKVKTAGLAKKVVAAKRPAPSFQTTAALRSEPDAQDVDAEAIFT